MSIIKQIGDLKTTSESQRKFQTSNGYNRIMSGVQSGSEIGSGFWTPLENG